MNGPGSSLYSPFTLCSSSHSSSFSSFSSSFFLFSTALVLGEGAGLFCKNLDLAGPSLPLMSVCLCVRERERAQDLPAPSPSRRCFFFFKFSRCRLHRVYST